MYVVADQPMQKTPEDQLPHPSRIAVRVNGPHTPVFERDIVSIVRHTFFFFPLIFWDRDPDMAATAATL